MAVAIVVRADLSTATNPLPPAKQAIQDLYNQYSSVAPASKVGDVPPDAIPDDPWPAGIFTEFASPFPSSEVTLENMWQDVVGGEHIQVYAGALTDDPTQGEVIEIETSLDLATSTGTWFNTSVKAGSVHIAASEGGQLIVVSATGTTFLFNPVRKVFPPLTQMMSVFGPTSPNAGASAGGEHPAVSSDGRYLAFEAGDIIGDGLGNQQQQDVYLKDLLTDAVTRVSHAMSGAANGRSFFPAVSSDGRYVAFESEAENLVSGDANGSSDVFRFDRDTGAISLVSVGTSAASANGASYTPAISSNGRYVAFISDASNLIASDTNGVMDTFVRDMQTGTTTRVSIAGNGVQANAASPPDDASSRELYRPAISADGSQVAFVSLASNLSVADVGGYSDIFVRDLPGATTKVESVNTAGVQGAGNSYSPSLSNDGNILAFTSKARLAEPDGDIQEDVFYRDIVAGTTNIASKPVVTPNFTTTTGGATTAVVSGDGKLIAFADYSSMLVPNDTNGYEDVFLYDIQHDSLTRASVTDTGAEANYMSYSPTVSGDGRFVGFESFATNLQTGVTKSSAYADVFRRAL